MKCPICDGMGTSNTCVNGTFKPCSFCDGTGEVMTDDVKIRCDDCKFVEDCVDYGWQECKKFTPTQKKRNTKETTELKPCPFCGGEAKTGRIFGHETVFCTECDACILPSPYNSFANTDKELDESIKMWNVRVVAE